VARRVGLVEWTLDIPGPKTVPYRDTRGPGRSGFQRLVAAAEAQQEPKRSRDLAILWLLYGRALRRSEACRLQVPTDLDLVGGRIRIHGKHRADPEWVTVPPATVRALQHWLSVRGDHAGPLFTRCDHAAVWSGTPQSLSGDAIWVIVRSLGNAAGIRARPHGLRHAAVTDALAATHGDIRSVQRFARLKSTTTIQIYDDERADLGGEVSRLLAP
jgi:integrase/recombinase XerC